MDNTDKGNPLKNEEILSSMMSLQDCQVSEIAENPAYTHKNMNVMGWGEIIIRCCFVTPAKVYMSLSIYLFIPKAFNAILNEMEYKSIAKNYTLKNISYYTAKAIESHINNDNGYAEYMCRCLGLVQFFQLSSEKIILQNQSADKYGDFNISIASLSGILGALFTYGLIGLPTQFLQILLFSQSLDVTTGWLYRRLLVHKFTGLRRLLYNYGSFVFTALCGYELLTTWVCYPQYLLLPTHHVIQSIYSIDAYYGEGITCEYFCYSSIIRRFLKCFPVCLTYSLFPLLISSPMSLLNLKRPLYEDNFDRFKQSIMLPDVKLSYGQLNIRNIPHQLEFEDEEEDQDQYPISSVANFKQHSIYKTLKLPYFVFIIAQAVKKSAVFALMASLFTYGLCFWRNRIGPVLQLHTNVRNGPIAPLLGYCLSLFGWVIDVRSERRDWGFNFLPHVLYSTKQRLNIELNYSLELLIFVYSIATLNTGLRIQPKLFRNYPWVQLIKWWLK